MVVRRLAAGSSQLAARVTEDYYHEGSQKRFVQIHHIVLNAQVRRPGNHHRCHMKMGVRLPRGVRKRPHNNVMEKY